MNGSPSAETHGRTELFRPLSIGFPGSPESGVLPLGIGGGLERLESMMPSRILREGIISSEAVNSLSESAENFYRRLMSIVDDYGRYFAHPALLRAACYPLKLDSVSDADVQQRLSECEAAGLVVVYGVDSKSFLWIANFRQQTRSKSKFPEPVETDLLSKCEANDKHLLAGSYKSRRDSNTNTTTEGEGGTLGLRGSGREGVDNLRNQTIPGSVADVEAWAEMDNLPKEQAAEFFDHYSRQGWQIKGGVWMTDARAGFKSWCRNGKRHDEEKGAKGFWKAEKQLGRCEEEIRAIQARAIETPLETKIQERDVKRFAELKKRRKDLKEQLEKL